MSEVRYDRGQRRELVRYVRVRLALQTRLLEEPRSKFACAACDRVRVSVVLLGCTGQLCAVLGEDLAEQLHRASGVRLPLGAKLVTMLAEHLGRAGDACLALGVQPVSVLAQQRLHGRAMIGVRLLEALDVRLRAGVEQCGD
jgi:hypothetical protein